MKIVGRQRLQDFCAEHADARRWVENWLADTQAVIWRQPHDIKQRYATASFLPNSRVVFNVKGNDYRLEVLVAYRTGVVVVEWVGTHQGYDMRNARR